MGERRQAVHVEQGGIQTHLPSRRDQCPAQHAARAETPGELGPPFGREGLAFGNLREDGDRLGGMDPAHALEIRAKGHHQLSAEALERRVRRDRNQWHDRDRRG